jgi:hypothetical protein
VPIRDFISLSSPLVAVSLLFLWCATVKKEIPKNCGAAVANKKLSGSPAVFQRDANDDRQIQIARAWGDCRLKTFTTSAINNAVFHSCMCIGFLPNRRLANASVVRGFDCAEHFPGMEEFSLNR